VSVIIFDEVLDLDCTMQQTRRLILEILRSHADATVDDLVDALRSQRGDEITAVTVRHHLNALQKENLVTSPEIQHRSTPGRPKYIYRLTNEARKHFPDNYAVLTASLLNELHDTLPQGQFNVLLEGVANRIADNSNIPELPLQTRMEQVVTHLTKLGYEASYKAHEEGYLLITSNCPYHVAATDSLHLCEMDLHLISRLLGTIPRLISRLSNGDLNCCYFIPNPDASNK
jgi:predicted ArsR family transcriptional regulator